MCVLPFPSTLWGLNTCWYFCVNWCLDGWITNYLCTSSPWKHVGLHWNFVGLKQDSLYHWQFHTELVVLFTLWNMLRMEGRDWTHDLVLKDQKDYNGYLNLVSGFFVVTKHLSIKINVLLFSSLVFSKKFDRHLKIIIKIYISLSQGCILGRFTKLI